MPVVILQRLVPTALAWLAVFNVFHGDESYDYSYEVGTATLSEEIILGYVAKKNYLMRVQSLFLAEVHLETKH